MKVSLTKEQFEFLEKEVIPANKRMFKFFQEIVESAKQTDNIQRDEICPSCNGEGAVNGCLGPFETCRRCNGSGKLSPV